MVIAKEHLNCKEHISVVAINPNNKKDNALVFKKDNALRFTCDPSDSII